MALREITDDSGGRTEIVRDTRDLDPAVSSIADELSKQYYLGYPSPGVKDGRWHTIRVELRDPSLKVRARKGYIASSRSAQRSAPGYRFPAPAVSRLPGSDAATCRGRKPLAHPSQYRMVVWGGSTN